MHAWAEKAKKSTTRTTDTDILIYIYMVGNFSHGGFAQVTTISGSRNNRAGGGCCMHEFILLCRKSNLW